MLEINKTVGDGKAVFSLKGRIDTVTASEFEKELDAVCEETDELIVDLEKTDYISSAGLRVLLSAQKTMSQKGGMKVMNVCSTVMDIFEVTGFTDILTIEPAPSVTEKNEEEQQ